MMIIDPLRHHPLTIDGERVGDVVSLGLRVVVYTTDKRLADLDGKHFAGFDSAVAAVREALAADKLRERAGTVARLWPTPRPAQKLRPAAKPQPAQGTFPPLQPAAPRRGPINRSRH